MRYPKREKERVEIGHQNWEGVVRSIEEFSNKVTSAKTTYRCVLRESSSDNLIEVWNNRVRHFVALIESLSCPGVRIWTKQTTKYMRGKAEERLVSVK